MIKHSVDLKWSCWSKHVETWIDRGYGHVLQDTHAAFLGLGPAVTVLAGPRKEIRYGKVVVTRGRAEGSFACEWDEVDDLAGTLGLLDADGEWEEPSDREAFVESLPFSSQTWELGVDRDFAVSASSFEELMRLVDAEEAACVAESDEAWEEIEDMYRKRE
jgi:hypothetical protein